MATINIGNLAFTHKGDYDGSTAYAKNDVVYYASTGSAYIAKQATTGNLPTSTAHWNIFSAGSGGIWNAGLSLGSAGQVVKVNSGGSALEFGTVSSDFVKVYATHTPSSSAGNQDYVYFTDAYQHYRVIYTDDGSTSGTSHYLQVGNGSVDTAANYRWQSHYTSNASGASHGSTSDNYMRLGWSGNGSGYDNTNIVDFLNVRDSSQATTVFGRRFCMDHGSTWLNVTMGARHEVNGVIDRFRILNASGNIVIQSIAIYGMKV